MRYFVRMNYVDDEPLTLYRFDAETLAEEMWSVNRWVQSPNIVVESIFKSGDLDEVNRDYAEDFFPQAFSRA